MSSRVCWLVRCGARAAPPTKALDIAGEPYTLLNVNTPRARTRICVVQNCISRTAMSREQLDRQGEQLRKYAEGHGWKLELLGDSGEKTTGAAPSRR